MGRRHQLARELVAQVPWLARAAVPRVAWVMRELADAGWTCPEVVAWLATREAPVLVRRPVAFLAARISGANEVVTSAEQRQRLVEAWRDDRRAVRDRHAEWDGRWAAPRSRTARTAVAGAFSAPLPEPADVDGAFVHRGGEEVLLDGLIEADVMAARELARQHPELIRMAVETQGLDYALSLYEPGLVHRAMREAAPATPGRRSR